MSSTTLKRAPSESQQTLAESVYEAILERILRGTLEPGTVLSAVLWAEKLEVSRTPVHEALRMLETDGLVVNHAGRRAQVAEFTRDDLWEIFEMRALLESRAAELAAGRMDERQLGPLRSLADSLSAREESEEWIAHWTDFDELFHGEIAEACGNRRLALDIHRYRLIHRGFNHVSTDYDSLQSALEEHVEILEALSARDPGAARAAMARHIENWQRYFVERFQ